MVQTDLLLLPSVAPGAVRVLLGRCLQKDVRRRRLSDIADARIEIDETLRAPATTRPPSAEPAFSSLAVLPFANASGDPEIDTFSDGLTASLTLNLSQLPNLRVMARSTVFAIADARAKGRTSGGNCALRRC